MSILINASCATCRRCKYIGMDLYKCKYRNESFYLDNKTICENWLPSKTDLKIWIKRNNK